ncbi:MULTISPECIES: ATP phosphoribosyltransferase regulatory subunit [Planktothricoides]|uniref:ATP phosphoribosyltransferase regulatory subunit n=2 Tax=Planktothricoides raciborskii TaxID=132608 RepID=A0AAU8JJ84_9CYAN|nr:MULTISPECIES: ATP phosphoribosyltransferase regulatory subunit [Planktothricoides]KOR35128.1 ATP phosphoribosyltransferase [Planktothricoides sp. SR001]MBD2547604.1 ATP phosphoribosyltransferase regulatory subunit [Planktothricoides raciborskii FACHB-1370]MBD2584604.1 ATP phosphoribosyltransferase regulatory subunit [Planktothricoides raciborskii FACHB-1261]
MIHQPPSGARDLLPLDVAQKRWIEKRLRPVFQQWGYHRIITSTVERLDTLMAGGTIQQSTVIQLEDREDDIPLGLRPELTASIARAAVTRMAESSYPLRLYYNGNVFRRSPEVGHGGQQEFFQAGVELLGAGGLLADAEILLLLFNSLHSLGLNQWQIILGEAGLTASLLSPFPEPLRRKIREAIAHLDRLTLETLPMSSEQRERALLLFDLRGKPEDVLQKVASLPLDPAQQTSLENLKSLVDLLKESSSCNQTSAPGTDALILDLSLIRPFDYYTGIIFEVVNNTPSGQQILGQGGRYDQLLSLYHPEGTMIPGIGFCFNIEGLHRVLRSTGQLPQQTPPTQYLVAPKVPQAQAAAFTFAQTLRQSGENGQVVRVEMNLEAGQTEETVRDYARSRQIRQIAWVSPDSTAELETV